MNEWGWAFVIAALCFIVVSCFIALVVVPSLPRKSARYRVTRSVLPVAIMAGAVWMIFWAVGESHAESLESCQDKGGYEIVRSGDSAFCVDEGGRIIS